MARDQDQVDLPMNSNIFPTRRCYGSGSFPAGVVTCERGIFQVSQEQEQQRAKAAVVWPAATHPYSLSFSLSLSAAAPTFPSKRLTASESAL